MSLYADIRGCTSCAAREKCKGPVPGDGPLNARVMLVGEAPGETEDEGGRPFTGRAGMELERYLKEAGLKREEVYITNLVKCRPPGNADPTPETIDACAPRWLEREIAEIEPEIVVTLGRFSSRYLTGSEDTMEHLHGYQQDRHGTTILPVYHPAAGLRRTSLMRQIEGDFQALGMLVHGVDPEALQVADEYPTPDYRWAEECRLGDGEYGMDTETVDGEVYSVQVGFGEGHAVMVAPDSLHIEGDVVPVTHNYLYDAAYIPYLRQSGVKNIDTMVAAYLLGLPQSLKTLARRLCGMEMLEYEEMVLPYRRGKAYSYLLEALGHEWDAPEPLVIEKWDADAGKLISKTKKPKHMRHKIQDRLERMRGSDVYDPYVKWFEIDKREREQVELVLGPMPDANIHDVWNEDRATATTYACRDADATIRVWGVLRPMLEAQGLLALFEAVEMPLLPILLSMMRQGMAVDRGWLEKLGSEFGERMGVVAGEIARVAGHSVNPLSGPQVAQVVYEEMGHEVRRRSKLTRNPATDDRALKGVGGEFAEKVLEYRGLAKLRGTYVNGLLDRQEDGVIHCTIKPTRTETGRLATEDPNLQNIPGRSTDGKKIRGAFVARSGQTLVSADYSQIEMRVMAYESQCREMTDLFVTGRDIHTETAAKVFGVGMEEAKSEKYRRPIKPVGFGVIYGITDKGLYETFIEEGIPGYSVEDCAKLIEEWYKIYPEVKIWSQETTAYAIRHGYVRDMFGRIRWIPEMRSPIKDIREAGVRQAVNMPIQSGAQGVIKLAQAKYEEVRPEYVRMLMQIHDEMLMEAPPERLVEFLPELVGTMQSAASLGRIPLEVSVKTGKNWNAMEVESGEA